MEIIEHWAATLLSDTPPVTAVSFAVFTCSGADVWIEFPSPIPFENEFTIADRPALRQLARLDADYTNALVLLDAQTARVLRGRARRAADRDGFSRRGRRTP